MLCSWSFATTTISVHARVCPTTTPEQPPAASCRISSVQTRRDTAAGPRGRHCPVQRLREHPALMRTERPPLPFLVQWEIRIDEAGRVGPVGVEGVHRSSPESARARSTRFAFRSRPAAAPAGRCGECVEEGAIRGPGAATGRHHAVLMQIPAEQFERALKLRQTPAIGTLDGAQLRRPAAVRHELTRPCVEINPHVIGQHTAQLVASSAVLQRAVVVRRPAAASVVSRRLRVARIGDIRGDSRSVMLDYLIHRCLPRLPDDTPMLYRTALLPPSARPRWRSST